jgi:hypothetical protein
LALSVVSFDLACNCDMGGCVIRKAARKGSRGWKQDRRVRYNLRVVTLLHNNVVNDAEMAV